MSFSRSAPDLAPAQAVAGDQQQHGVVAPPVRLTNAGHGEQAAHLLPRQGAGHLGEPAAPARWHRAHQVRPAVPRHIQPPVEARQRRGQMVPRRPPQASPALAAEGEQVVRAQRRQLGRAHRSAAAGQEVAKVAPVVGYRRFGEPAIMTQEPATALDQLAVRRLVRRDRGEGAFLAQHHEQVRQAPAGRFFPAARRAAVTAAPRQMTGEEARDDPPHREPGRFPAPRAGTCRGERRRARNPGTSARHSRARAASGPAGWPPVRTGPPPSARRTAHSRTLRASPTSMTRA